MRIAIAAVVACLLIRSAQAQLPPGDLEMGRTDTTGARAAVDPKVLAQFAEEYAAVVDAPRPVFEKYIPLLGAAALLDFLEEKYPACHGQAHDLGKALFSARGDLGQAIRDCGTRCTSGCMHGAVGEAFGSSSPDAIVAKMNTFCNEGDMARLHKPGNCAHALGHALMFVNSGNVTQSVNDCLRFDGQAMQYYCATGVFMEKILTGPKENRDTSSPHAPCDSERLFPTACYRYKATELLRKSKDHRILTRECLSLDAAQRLGCFHGLGHAVTHAIYENPERLGQVCAPGNERDRIVCVEGAIEKLAEFDEGRAKAACATLDGKAREACDAAASGKMYSLTRPDWGLYYDRDAVAKRKAATEKKQTEDANHHAHH